MKIQTIICDLGNVLLHFDHMRPCKQLSKLIKVPANHIYEKMFTSGLEKEYDLGRITSRDFGHRIIKELNLDLDLEEIQRLWVDIFWPVPGMEDLVRRLKGKYQLVLLSNTNEWHFEHCFQTYPVVQLFEHFAISYKLGQRKPDRAIYQSAISMAGTLPESCLYIDDIKEFILGAESQGIHGICFEDAEQLATEMRALGIQWKG